MNYRHAFHAGNFADVVKHAALLALLAQLQADPAPLQILDTHAGAGLYDLKGPDPRRSGEAEAGIMQLMGADAPAEFDALKAAVRAANEDRREVRLYPGSPWLCARSLRAGDAYLGCELRPDDHGRLVQALSGFPAARAERTDGYRRAAAALAAPGRRLVLVDPPFERSDDYAHIVDLMAACRRSGQTLLAWLPLKDLETFDAFLREAEAAAGTLAVGETRVRPLDDPLRMNGCALATVGAPEGFLEALDRICRFVGERGGPGGAGRAYRLA